MATVQCSECRSILELDDADLGRKVQCGSCQAVFKAEEMNGDRPTRQRAEEDRPSRRRDDDDDRPSRRRNEDDDDRPSRRRSEDRYDDEDDDRPRRRSRRDDDREDDLEDARRAVAAPAMTMLVISIICMLIGVVGTMVALVQLGGPNGGKVQGMNGQQQDPAVNAVQSVVIALWNIPIAIGAYQMRGLKSRGWAMTAAIMGMIPCSGCCLFTLPVGIWMLTVLNKPHVKDSFA